MTETTAQAPAPVKHLWEHEHPYYCEPGSFYQRGHHHRFGSWAEFATPTSFTHGPDGRLTGSTGTALYDGDPDQNLLFRWDWKAWHLDPDYEPEVDSEEERHTLRLFFMLQRKGANCSVEVEVTPEDEPAVRAWLASRAATIREMWAPFLSA